MLERNRRSAGAFSSSASVGWVASWHRVPTGRATSSCRSSPAPVALFPATTTRDRVRFNIINRETGNRVRNDVVDAETGDEVPQEDRVKGYKLDRRRLRPARGGGARRGRARKHAHDRHRELRRAREVDELYLDESYYLVPDDKVAYEAFAVIREAMRQEGLVGLARVVLYRRERLLMLPPRGKGIVGTTLRYKNEVRDETDLFRRHSGRQGPDGHARAGEAHSADQEGGVRPLEVRGSLRGRAQEADQGQAGRQEAAGADRAAADQRHQPDGCLAPQRAGRAARRIVGGRTKQGAEAAGAEIGGPQARSGRAQEAQAAS